MFEPQEGPQGDRTALWELWPKTWKRIRCGKSALCHQPQLPVTLRRCQCLQICEAHSSQSQFCLTGPSHCNSLLILLARHGLGSFANGLMWLYKSGWCWGERLSPRKLYSQLPWVLVSSALDFKRMIMYENSSSSNISTLCSGELWIYTDRERADVSSAG